MRDLAAFSGSDRDLVNRTDRRDLGGGAGEEKFVGQIERGALDGRFDDFDAEFAGNLNDRIARNSGQNRSTERRRDQFAVVDENRFSPEPSETITAIVKRDAFA